ncbi:OLC1v1023647C1 [Oldenlandia corymbosa var. corymbosa]|uniref:OLC1v1023647C1 n=1 Tax=Oldenlandia corymbosa var. corymbosa TaxID=529605 RepID=A0AAV1C1B3_OLDCO|nr:OLC1v1023647C1 [Oldenlandia corymbosa var. corymbosa]
MVDNVCFRKKGFRSKCLKDGSFVGESPGNKNLESIKIQYGGQLISTPTPIYYGGDFSMVDKVRLTTITLMDVYCMVERLGIHGMVHLYHISNEDEIQKIEDDGNLRTLCLNSLKRDRLVVLYALDDADETNFRGVGIEDWSEKDSEYDEADDDKYYVDFVASLSKSKVVVPYIGSGEGLKNGKMNDNSCGVGIKYGKDKEKDKLEIVYTGAGEQETHSDGEEDLEDPQRLGKNQGKRYKHSLPRGGGKIKCRKCNVQGYNARTCQNKVAGEPNEEHNLMSGSIDAETSKIQEDPKRDEKKNHNQKGMNLKKRKQRANEESHPKEQRKKVLSMSQVKNTDAKIPEIIINRMREESSSKFFDEKTSAEKMIASELPNTRKPLKSNAKLCSDLDKHEGRKETLPDRYKPDIGLLLKNGMRVPDWMHLFDFVTDQNDNASAPIQSAAVTYWWIGKRHC